MSRLVPVALFLASVASAQGIPRPPAFNPVTDSPITTGHPGYTAPRPERSPSKRYLPPTKEPGIWAADKPSNVALVDILGVAPPETNESGTATGGPFVYCANTMNRVIDALDFRAHYRSFPTPSQRCIAARLYLACAAYVRPSGTIVSQDALRAATDLAAKECGGQPTTDDATRHVEAVIAEWTRRTDDLYKKGSSR